MVNKNWLFGIILLGLPLISAAEGLDLYYLFVENVFGSRLLATIGFMAIFTLFGMMSRMSFTLIVMLLGLFVMVSMMGFVGTAAVFVFGLIAIYYLFAGIVRFIL